MSIAEREHDCIVGREDEFIVEAKDDFIVEGENELTLAFTPLDSQEAQGSRDSPNVWDVISGCMSELRSRWNQLLSALGLVTHKPEKKAYHIEAIQQ